MLGNQKVEKTFLARRYGATQVHVMYDYGPFHGKKNIRGSVMYLYADGHIGDSVYAGIAKTGRGKRHSNVWSRRYGRRPGQTEIKLLL